MKINKVGIIGNGEVGRALIKGLTTNKNLYISVYDILFNDRNANSLAIEERKQGVKIEKNLDSLIKKNELIISAVTCEFALILAEEVSKYLGEGKIFIDMNTLAPQIERQIGKLIEKRQASFVEIAILGTIASYGYKSPMLACGTKAPDLTKFLNAMDFNVTYFSKEIGQASMMKMLRSVFSKGVESLLIEMLIAAERCNLLGPLMEAVVSHMDKSSFLDIAETWITTNVIHAKRRTEEMDHVIQTLNGLKVEPIMSAATRERLRQCSEFSQNIPIEERRFLNYCEVIKSMSELMD